jgi:hypothetical protein
VSTSLFPADKPQVRPTGVLLLAFAHLALGAYLIGNGLLVLLHAVSFASGSYLLGGLEIMGPAIYFLIGLALCGIGLGLMRGWRWSRWGAIVAAALLLVGAIMPVSAAVIYFQLWNIVTQGVKVILSIVIIRFLLQQEVVDFFSAKSG